MNGSKDPETAGNRAFAEPFNGMIGMQGLAANALPVMGTVPVSQAGLAALTAANIQTATGMMTAANAANAANTAGAGGAGIDGSSTAQMMLNSRATNEDMMLRQAATFAALSPMGLGAGDALSSAEDPRLLGGASAAPAPRLKRRFSSCPDMTDLRQRAEDAEMSAHAMTGAAALAGPLGIPLINADPRIGQLPVPVSMAEAFALATAAANARRNGHLSGATASPAAVNGLLPVVDFANGGAASSARRNASVPIAPKDNGGAAAGSGAADGVSKLPKMTRTGDVASGKSSLRANVSVPMNLGELKDASGAATCALRGRSTRPTASSASAARRPRPRRSRARAPPPA